MSDIVEIDPDRVFQSAKNLRQSAAGLVVGAPYCATFHFGASGSQAAMELSRMLTEADLVIRHIAGQIDLLGDALETGAQDAVMADDASVPSGVR